MKIPQIAFDIACVVAVVVLLLCDTAEKAALRQQNKELYGMVRSLVDLANQKDSVTLRYLDILINEEENHHD